MCKICSDIGLTDLMDYMHGSTNVATYSRGTKRLDYALGSLHVTEALRFCGYEPFHHRMVSDHRAYFLDFDTLMLFGSDTPELPPMAFRDIQSKSPKQVSVYIKSLHAQMKSRNCFERIEELFTSDEPCHWLANRLDGDLLQFCLSSASKCRRYREPQWSKVLDAARNKVNILRRALTVRKVGIDINAQIRIL
jgi:hypothetical protein